MDKSNQEDKSDETRCRKFGLPNWMVNNIERLNFVTDFEQYACSPPENESFLSECNENYDFHDASESHCPIVEPTEFVDSKPEVQIDSKADVETKYRSSPLFSDVDHTSAAYHSLVSNIKHEEFCSSPDSTPCATPEPSPVPRRKMSGQQYSVQTNPGKWFYLGNLKKQEQNLKKEGLSINRNKENRIKDAEKANDTSVKQDSSVKHKKDGIKLVISNFDINAISPTSW